MSEISPRSRKTPKKNSTPSRKTRRLSDDVFELRMLLPGAKTALFGSTELSKPADGTLTLGNNLASVGRDAMEDAKAIRLGSGLETAGNVEFSNLMPSTVSQMYAVDEGSVFTDQRFEFGDELEENGWVGVGASFVGSGCRRIG